MAFTRVECISAHAKLAIAGGNSSNPRAFLAPRLSAIGKQPAMCCWLVWPLTFPVVNICSFTGNYRRHKKDVGGETGCVSEIGDEDNGPEESCKEGGSEDHCGSSGVRKARSKVRL
jgi:hypothetical protein